MNCPEFLLNGFKFGIDFVQNSAWPLVAAGVILYLVKAKRAPARILEFVSLFDSFKLGGTEFVFNKEARERAEVVFAKFRNQVTFKCDDHVKAHGINRKLADVAENVMSADYDLRAAGDLRWTIHIPDILFDATLYQLIDYYPVDKSRPGKGRTWSIRFGIIGLAWRTSENQVQGQVPTSPEELVSNWSMTDEEARKAGRGRQSFLCLVLKDINKRCVGILYVDSMKTNVFDKTLDRKREIIEAIEAECERQKLAVLLSDLLVSLRPSGALIGVHESFV